MSCRLCLTSAHSLETPFRGLASDTHLKCVNEKPKPEIKLRKLAKFQLVQKEQRGFSKTLDKPVDSICTSVLIHLRMCFSKTSHPNVILTQTRLQGLQKCGSRQDPSAGGVEMWFSRRPACRGHRKASPAAGQIMTLNFSNAGSSSSNPGLCTFAFRLLALPSPLC